MQTIPEAESPAQDFDLGGGFHYSGSYPRFHDTVVPTQHQVQEEHRSSGRTEMRDRVRERDRGNNAGTEYDGYDAARKTANPRSEI